MSLPLKTGFPENITIRDGFVVRFRATDPTTGAEVAGVKVSNASVFVDNVGSVALEPSGPFMWVPGPNQ